MVTLHSIVVVVSESKVLFHSLSTAGQLPCRQSLLYHFTYTIPYPPSPQTKSKNLQPYTPVSVNRFHSFLVSRDSRDHQSAANNAQIGLRQSTSLSQARRAVWVTVPRS